MKEYEALFREMGLHARKSSVVLNQLNEDKKNEMLYAIANALECHKDEILAANNKDLTKAVENSVKTVMLDRLRLTEQRILDIANGVRQVVTLPDPTNRLLATFQRENGLVIEKRSVPLGVVLIIYEARPNVTIDAAALCLKAGNAVVLRGGKEAFETNTVITSIIRAAISSVGIPTDCVQLVPVTDRAAVSILLEQNKYIDVVIPRGSAALINRVVSESKIPVIETGAGICHTYIDKDADLKKAIPIILNAKVQRPSVCNAMETLLVHTSVAEKLFQDLLPKLWDAHVELRFDSVSKFLAMPIWDTYQERHGNNLSASLFLTDANNEDWVTEYNDLILSIRIVESIDVAIEHISAYGTKHSECIVTENKDRADLFMLTVDASTVYHNASTRFTDGFEFGFGAEIGISTQKLHARGPMGLPELTSYKYFVHGDGQVRK